LDIKTGAILTLLIASASLSAYSQDPDIYGAYQSCSMACERIQIKPDHTFILQLDGDLYNDQRHNGTWILIGPNTIHATIPKDNSPMKVAEGKMPGSEGYRLEVIDVSGMVIKGATIIPLGLLPTQRFKTDSAGVAKIPVCDEFELSVLSYHGRYRPMKIGNNKFIITLTADQVLALAIDEIWIIEKKRLYKKNIEAGTINKEFWLEKMSKKQERVVFN
jgi:hypothetical protein